MQPEGDPTEWATPPFVATEIDGRLFGRGVSDDKGGFAVHLGALRAFGGKPPVGVTLFIEGEEEVGSADLAQLLEEYREELTADVYLIADSSNWAVEQPAFTTSLRGLAECTVEVRTLSHGVHSGEYGGVVPDALIALCRLLATLHDDQGNVAITPGSPPLRRRPWSIRPTGCRQSRGCWTALTGSALGLSWSECGASPPSR